MTRLRPLLLLAVMLGIGLGGALYRDARSSSDPAAASESAVAAGRAPTVESFELAQLRQEVMELRHQVRSHEQRLAAPSEAPPVPSSTEPPGIEDRAEQVRRYHEYIAGVDAAFRQEARDPRWSADTSAVIQAALTANQELQPLAGSIECRSRTCRVELTDDGSGVLHKQLPVLTQQVGQVLPSMTSDRVEDGSGRAMMVLYFSGAVEPASAR